MKTLEELKPEMVTCVVCGWCTVDCPTRHVKTLDSYSARGRLVLCEQFLRGMIPASPELAERIQTCTTCRRCNETCPAHIEQYEIIEAARAKLVESGVQPPPQFAPLAENIMKIGNVLGEKQDFRADLAKELQTDPDSETALWLGCMFSYRYTNISRSIAAILKSAGYSFRMLGDKETDCGDPLKMVGLSGLFKEKAKQNLDLFREKGVKRIITPCPMCAKAFKQAYLELFPDMGIEVKHIAEVYDQLLKEGRLKFTKEVPMKITYFDPCHLGRHMKIFDPPRNVLKAIPGIEYQDIPGYSKENNWCCGGAIRVGYTDLSVAVSEEALAKIEKGGFQAVITACPQCFYSIKFATFDTKVYDMSELVAAAMGIKELGSGVID